MAKKRGVDFKALMLAHIEKVVCAIIAICFITLMWFAVSKDGVPAGIEPADIQGVAAQAKTNVTRTTWEDFSAKPQMRNFAQESGWYTIPFDPYEITSSIDPPTFRTQGLRDDPKYFGISQLESHYDQGTLALLSADYLRRKFGQDGPVPVEVQNLIDKAKKKPEPPPRGGMVDDPNRLVDKEGIPIKIKMPGEPVEDYEVAEGHRWAMVTALLPVQKQRKAFEEVFRNTAGFEQKNDLPIYFGYEVERADVTGGASPVWKPHEKVSSKSMLISTLRWPRYKRSEIIDSRYIQPIFTCPLPPRVLQSWSSGDKHSEIPLKSSGQKEVEADVLLADELDGLGQDRVADVDALLSDAKRSSKKTDEDTTVPMKMVRYFDFDLEAGRAYIYRFRAVLRDPNYIREPVDRGEGLRRVEIKLLEQPVIARLTQKRNALAEAGNSPELVERLMQIIYTPWSDPSPAVKVPPETHVLAVGTQPATPGKYNEEPSATIMITKYEPDLGVETGGQTKLERGSMSKFTMEKIRVINMDYNTIDFKQKTFDPNMILLDTRGGEALGESSLTSPGELLLLDLSNGKVILNSEIEDAQSIREYEERQRKIGDLIPQDTPSNRNRSGPLDIDVLN